MIQGLENLETKHKVKLTIPLVASYLARGVKRTKIAEICNISNQAVYDYCDRHYEELAPLIDISDSIMAMKSKHIAEKAQKRILIHLDESEKKDLFALNAISGTHIDKYRLLSDKSTFNLSVDVAQERAREARAKIIELRQQLNSNNNGVEMGNQEDTGEKH